jgi:phage FluMu gp28-like protein
MVLPDTSTIVAKPGWTRLYPKQRDAIYDPARYSFIEASTKSGKTVGCILWIVDQAAQGKEGYEYWWVAPIREQAKIAYRRLKRYLRKEAKVWYQKNDSDLALILPNGARIVCKGSDRPDSLYGEDVHAAVIDEASRCKEEAWHAIRSTLTHTRGPCRVIGNVKGRKNWAFRMGQKARRGIANYAYHRITAMDAVRAGVLALEEIIDAREALPLDAFNELYLAIATDDGANPFGIKAIRNCLLDDCLETTPVVWGWDLGRKQDWTVGIGLDEYKQVCRFERFQKPWPETIRIIGEAVGDSYAVCDATGLGDGIVQQLQTDYPSGTFEEFIFSQRSKQQIMEALAIDVQRGDILFPKGVVQQEMEDFEYVYTKTGVKFEAPEGLHDDCVCALAMARKGHFEENWASATMW